MIVADDAMDRVIPKGYVVVCDPDVESLSGCMVAASLYGRAVMRRWYGGSDTALLVTESHSRHDDVVARDGDDDARVLGTAVWAQCAAPLA